MAHAMLHTLSRAIHEEVQFDADQVTSVDWVRPTCCCSPRRVEGGLGVILGARRPYHQRLHLHYGPGHELPRIGVPPVLAPQ